MYAGDDTPTQVRLASDEAFAAKLSRRLRGGSSARAQRLARIKRAVASSEYENDLKMSVALDRLLDRLQR